MPIYAANDLMTPEALGIAGRLFPALIVGTLIGILLHRHVNEALFRKIVLWMVMIAGLAAIVGGLKG